jgi:hypothetical protein
LTFKVWNWYQWQLGFELGSENTGFLGRQAVFMFSFRQWACWFILWRFTELGEEVGTVRRMVVE